MASLLAWFTWAGPDPDPHVWQSMCDRAQQRSRFPGSAQSGPGWRIWAAPTTRLDRPPVQWQFDGTGESCLVLLDRPVGADDSRATGLRWSAERLMDGEPTAAIMFESQSRRVIACRDLMGQRNLVWSRVPGGVILASGEHVLRAHPSVSGELDRVWLAAYLAALPPHPEATVWQHVRSLAAGQTRTWQGSRSTATTRPPVPDQRWRGCTDQQVQSQFEELLFAAVDKCTFGSQRVGVSLSAGMDSSTVAWVVSHRNSSNARPLAVTYGLEAWPEIDERALVARLAQGLGIDHLSFDASGLHPFRPACARPVNPDTPLQTPYREWKEAAYRYFVDGGADVVLSGNFSDHLWAPPHFCLHEALRLGRWRVASEVVKAVHSDAGFHGVLANWGVRALARPWRLRRLPDPQRLQILAQPWRDEVRAVWEAQREPMKHWPRPAQAMSALSSSASFDAFGEDWFAARHGLTFRQPFRDSVLTAWMLSIPADFSYRGHRWKWLMRRTMVDRLPTEVLDRPKASDLRPIARSALALQRADLERLVAPLAPILEPLLAPSADRIMEETDWMWTRAGLALWLQEPANAPEPVGRLS